MRQASKSPVLLSAALLLSACHGSAAGRPEPVQAQVALRAAASCDELGKSIQDAAVHQLRSQLDRYKSNQGYPIAVGGPNGGSPTPTTSTPPASYTTTNTQVAGVDEGDFMKNDGTRIFVLSGDSLYAARSWPPQDLALASRLPIEGWPQSMFLTGDTLVVLSTLWSQAAAGGGGGLCPRTAGGALPVMCWGGNATTKVTLVDATDLRAPKVIGEQYLPGYLNGSRRVDSSVRLVLADSPRWPAAVKWWPDWDPAYQDDHDKLVAAIDKLEDEDEKIIRATPAQSWFPEGKRKLEDGTLVDVTYQCSDFYLSNAPERLGLLTVATLDLAQPAAPPSRASIVGEPGVVYSTATSLYVASEHWWWWDAPGQADHTYLHKLDLSDPRRAVYLASGGVPGHLLNQYSLDEWNGYLRVAATTSEKVSGGQDKQWKLKVGNHVAVLAPEGDRLAVVGDTGLLVADEGIRGARFAGGKGYVDTFRGVDPLITLDLGEPARPRKVGELTLPGFSTYLQPIDDKHLLAIGTDIPPPDPVTGRVDWNRRALQLSIFDVSDLAHPARSAQALVGTMNAWSEALYDHHAFNWYGQRGLLAIPLSDWQQGGQSWSDGFVSQVRVFGVDASSITPRGALGMEALYLQGGNGQWTYQYMPWVRRSVMATDGAGVDYVYAVSDAGLRVAPLNDLGHPLATALFPRR